MDLALPLDSLHRELGGRMVSFAGYAMPIQFEGIIAEHNWTRTQAGLFDVSHMGQLVFASADDVALETLLPGDITGLKAGVLRYSMLLNDNGGILDDLMVTRREDDLYMVVNGATKHDDISVFRAAGLNPQYRDDWALLALQGPLAVAVLERLAPGVGSLSFMRGGAFALLGVPAWISRSGYTGEDGFEISVPNDAVEPVARALLTHAEVRPIGLGARDSLRLEAGLPLYGHDLTPAITPVEAGLAFAISKRRKVEGGFPGATHVLDQLLNGAPKCRVGLKVEGRLPAREGASVVAAEGVVGTVTSGGFGPALGAPIAMAMVDAAHVADGTALGIDVRGRILDATVVPMPFFPKSYVREGAPR
ncbi:glycine cleavage system aminomethyltransferase GcvT [Glacieibacterium frigidum]|uniref:aminomethyltransferase n=1 Tax=Glacieibacterium frigidum TaxID=2593303 RepID=A0A552UJD0_9SPHN|nr:glycine cleavage system aminomethyltransferase GcvT [Glacieibacterium frigidum]TRW18290.1 glycine cleavage system aminomethyltransferase GcvT [Glacieibacterium frigidum]